MLAAGGGWSWWERRVDLDLLVGWVPPLGGSDSIWPASLKVTVWPLAVDLGRDWRLRPISIGGLMTLTLGDDYFLFQPDRYPPGYYPFSTALRFGAFAGGSVGRAWEWGFIDGADLYWEFGVTDLELYLVLVNPRSRSFFDAVHVALGVALPF